MRRQVASILTMWVGEQIVFLAFLWQPELLWPGVALLVLGFLATIATTRPGIADTPSDPITENLHRMVEDDLRRYGPHAARSLRSRHALAIVHEKADRMDEAIELLERTVVDAEHAEGPDHAQARYYRDALAELYARAGRIDDAVAVHEQNRDLETALTPGDVDVLFHRAHLAEAYALADRTDDAVRLHVRNLADATRALGANHLHTLRLRNSLARTYEAIGRDAEAIALYEENITLSWFLGAHDYSETRIARRHLDAARLRSSGAGNPQACTGQTRDAPLA